MKYVIAITQPHKLEDVRGALIALDITVLSASEERRFGSSEEHVGIFRFVDQKVGFLAKIKIEFAASNEIVDRAIDPRQY